MEINFLFLLSNIILFYLPAINTCGNFNFDELVTGIEIDNLPQGSRIKRSVSPNLRIHFHYTENFIATPNSDVFKKHIMEPAKKELEMLLKAKNPSNGILRVDRRCIKGESRVNADGIRGCVKGCNFKTKCLGISIPEEYLKRCRTITDDNEIIYSGDDGPGIENVDIVIVVDFTICNDLTKANAVSCFTERQLDRPILGVIELCISMLQANIKENIKIVQHEIIHALGFAVNKYAFFRQSNGLPIVPRDQYGLPAIGKNYTERYYLWNDKITKKVKRSRESINGKYYKIMDAFVLENVVKVAQEHFGCSDIDAVDLEDVGGVGSALTHFDEYFLNNEIMTPKTNSINDVISKFTLALLKDTGWYEVDYSKTANFDYGKYKGCTLPLKGCYNYIEEQRMKKLPLDPFCDRVLQFGNIARCSKDRDYYDYCHLTKYNEIHKENQYFRTIPGIKDEDVEYYTGESEFNEFCPVKFTFSSPNSFCNDQTNTDLTDKYNILTSYYGNDSLCIENNLENDYGNVYYGASCQRYSRDSTKSKLQFFIGSESFICPSDKTFHFLIDNYYKISMKCPEDIRKYISMGLISKASNRVIILILGLFLVYFF